MGRSRDNRPSILRVTPRFSATLGRNPRRRGAARFGGSRLSPPGRGDPGRDHGWSDGSVVSRRPFLLAAVPMALAIGPAVSAAAPPVSTAPPAIDGLVLLGGTVNCREGGWDSVPDAINVSWTRDGAPITGADRRQDTIAEQDVGRPAARRRDRLRGNGEGDGNLGRRDSPKRRPRRRTRPRRAGGSPGPAGPPGATGKPGAAGPAGPAGSPPRARPAAPSCC